MAEYSPCGGPRPASGLTRGLRAWTGLAILTVALSGAAPCQEVEYYSPPSQKHIGARSTALGDATSSDQFDVGSMYLNPATLSFLANGDVMADHRYEYNNKVFQENIAARVYDGRAQAIGLGVGIVQCGTLTNHTPFRFSEFDVDAGYSLRILSFTPDVSLGVLGNFRFSSVESHSVSAAQFSIGLLYSPSAGTSYSVVYRGIGHSVLYTVAPDAPASTTLNQQDDVPRSLEIGSTMRFPAESREPFINLSVAGERDYVTKTLRVKGGIEAVIMSQFCLRLGYVNAEVRELRYGAGFSIGILTIDYAAMPWERAGKFNEVTLKIAM